MNSKDEYTLKTKQKVCSNKQHCGKIQTSVKTEYFKATIIVCVCNDIFNIFTIV